MKMKKKNDCPNSIARTKEFLDYYPVAHSNMRIKVSAQNYRMFIDHGEGSRLYDVDGNEYIDYCISYGPSALGSVQPELSAALIDLIKTQPTARSP
jgi:glutamate-1-semialdehyde 2,1-aminomutase